MVYSMSGFPGGSLVNNPPANAGDMGLIPGLGRSTGKGNDNTHWYSCLGNPSKPHGQRILVGYSPLGYKRVEHDLATK